MGLGFAKQRKRRLAVLTFKASDSGGEGIIHLCEVDHDGPQVTGRDRVVTIRYVGTIEGMVPFCGDLGASGYGDDAGRDRSAVRVESTVANNVF